jgi:hypothetical protein
MAEKQQLLGYEPVTKRCPGCGKSETNVFPSDGLKKWQSGMLIQRAMPNVNECMREFLITGFCEDCRWENDEIGRRIEEQNE